MGQSRLKLYRLLMFLAVIATVGYYNAVTRLFTLPATGVAYIQSHLLLALAFVLLAMGVGVLAVRFSFGGWRLGTILTLGLDVLVLLSAIFVDFGISTDVLRCMLHSGGLIPLSALNMAVALHWVFRAQ
ncbi:hypothetical protein ACLGL1_02005 [Peptococcus simiae]|uniref:hypothetical protein n=1 Tax=Peptococcus simiae TaxID=1643805 RepID=UPI003980B8AB